jgi:hypothetical protein
MSESPLTQIVRLLGGLVLLQGRLGHQVLGQLLIAGTSEAAIAGAAVVVAGTMRSQNLAAQVAIRTAAPAIAVHGLLRREEERIVRRDKLVSDREQKMIEHERKVEGQKRELRAAVTTLEAEKSSLDEDRIAEIRKNARLRKVIKALAMRPRARRSARRTKGASVATPANRPRKKPGR